MPELDRKALKEAASLGEKLFAATMANTDLKDRCEWADLHEWHRSSFEKTALAFAASLTHDETANATITALRASLEEAEGRARLLSDAHPCECGPEDRCAFALRAEAAEQRERRLREALTDCVNWIVELANSGDAGFWDAEKTPEVIKARAALSEED